MAFNVGSAANDLALLAELRDLLTGVSVPVYAAAPGGNPTPTITQPTAAGHATETWTITCTTGGADGVAAFSVVGSVSGAQDSAISGSAYDDVVAFTIGDGGGTFAEGDAWTFTTGDWTLAGAVVEGIETPIRSGTSVGNGTMTTPTVADGEIGEEFTLTCTTPGADGVAIFSVASTARGTMTSATSGSAYSSDGVAFTISAGATPWSAGDAFTFRVNARAFFRGDGADGTTKPIVAIKTSHSRASDLFNWTLQGATAYSAGLGFSEQPGAIPAAQGEPVVLLWNGTIDFALAATSEQFAGVAYAAGEPVESFFGGWIIPYGPPELWPAPLLIAGCHSDATAVASNVASTHTWGWRDFSDATASKSSAHLRTPGGSWARARAFGQTTLDNSELCVAFWPAGFVATNVAIAPTPGGDRLLERLQVVIHETLVGTDEGSAQTGDKALAGYVPLIAWVSGLGLSTGDRFAGRDGSNWFAFSNTHRSTVADFAALELLP